MFKTKIKTLIFVLEAPRDQDPRLEDYITGDVASDCIFNVYSVNAAVILLQVIKLLSEQHFGSLQYRYYFVGRTVGTSLFRTPGGVPTSTTLIASSLLPGMRRGTETTV